MFDVSRIPLGRVANKAAHFLRGKYKPTYDPKKLKGNGDMVVIVGADNIKMTGKKRQQKVYRYHTLYFGGFREKAFKEYQEKSPEKIVLNAIKGMLPRNKTSRALLDNVKVYRGMEHPHTNHGLPFFQPLPLPDPNELAGLNDFFDKDSPKTIVFHNLKDESEIPEEFKDVPIEFDDSLRLDSNVIPGQNFNKPKEA